MTDYRYFRRLMIKLLTQQLELMRERNVLSIVDCRAALAMSKELMELEQAELLDSVL